SPPVAMTRTGIGSRLASFSVQPLPSAVASSTEVVTTLSLGPAIVLFPSCGTSWRHFGCERAFAPGRLARSLRERARRGGGRDASVYSQGEKVTGPPRRRRTELAGGPMGRRYGP